MSLRLLHPPPLPCTCTCTCTCACACACTCACAYAYTCTCMIKQVLYSQPSQHARVCYEFSKISTQNYPYTHTYMCIPYMYSCVYSMHILVVLKARHLVSIFCMCTCAYIFWFSCLSATPNYSSIHLLLSVLLHMIVTVAKFQSINL